MTIPVGGTHISRLFDCLSFLQPVEFLSSVALLVMLLCSFSLCHQDNTWFFFLQCPLISGVKKGKYLDKIGPLQKNTF